MVTVHRFYGGPEGATGLNPGLQPWERYLKEGSLVSVNYTGWKPMLHCSPERRAMTRGHAGTIPQQTRRDARRRKVV